MERETLLTRMSASANMDVTVSRVQDRRLNSTDKDTQLCKCNAISYKHIHLSVP